MSEKIAGLVQGIREKWSELVVDPGSIEGNLDHDLGQMLSLLDEGRVGLATELVERWIVWCQEQAQETHDLVFDMQLTGIEVELEDLLEQIKSFAITEYAQLKSNLSRTVRVRGMVQEGIDAHLLDANGLVPNYVMFKDREVVCYAKELLPLGPITTRASVVVAEGRRGDEHVREFQLIKVE